MVSYLPFLPWSYAFQQCRLVTTHHEATVAYSEPCDRLFHNKDRSVGSSKNKCPCHCYQNRSQAATPFCQLFTTRLDHHIRSSYVSFVRSSHHVNGECQKMFTAVEMSRNAIDAVEDVVLELLRCRQQKSLRAIVNSGTLATVRLRARMMNHRSGLSWRLTYDIKFKIEPHFMSDMSRSHFKASRQSQ
jgi:hypothetical protein